MLNQNTSLSSRRNFNHSGLQLFAALLSLRDAGYSADMLALSIDDLNNKEASSGLRAALARGAAAAIDSLGKNDGFLSNPLVRIPLPGYMESAAKIMRNLGQSARIDELVTSMNRAAEQAVPLAKNLIVKTVKAISVTDAKNILSGGAGAATKYFAEKYNSLASKLQQFGLVKPDDANIQKYVTGKSLDGLYTMIGEEEKKIRQGSIGTGSALLSKVFGALK